MEEKIIVSNIEIEPREDGMKVLIITLKKGDKTYTKGARYIRYINKKDRKSIFRAWKREISKIEEENAIDEEEMKVNIKAMEGEELKDE